ncbi:MAG: sigma-54 dependent transcriptional regulator [Bacteroidota bacterium]
MGIFKIFVVEDDPWYGELLAYHLSNNPDYEVTLLASAKACLEKLHLKPDVICLDYGLPDMTGDQLLSRIHSVNDAIPLVIISGQREVSVAIHLLKSGATDYIIKDDNTRELLWNSILKIREHIQLKQEVEKLRDQLEENHQFEKFIIGQSGPIKQAFNLIEKACRSNINVSISGETGTGKELAAKAIHFNSPRRKKPFVAVNMTAIPKELLESELFGHEKGAFTGAIHRKIGKFEEAQGGTIFLDEIGDMDLSMQSKLLRVLQEREIVRVGGRERISLNVRLVSATHKKLSEEVRHGRFREDLFYRIMGLPIELPPLAHRNKDILILAKHFMDTFTQENRMGGLTISPQAKDKLLSYRYPGNVRELKSIIELACVMCNEEEITAEDISFYSSIKEADFTLIEKTLKEYTCDIVQHFLKKYNHNVVLVSEKLDIGKSTIYNMIKQGDIILKR